jgi:hypothetical protein
MESVAESKECLQGDLESHPGVCGISTLQYTPILTFQGGQDCPS